VSGRLLPALVAVARAALIYGEAQVLMDRPLEIGRVRVVTLTRWAVWRPRRRSRTRTVAV
jgi:hypothetical protein